MTNLCRRLRVAAITTSNHDHAADRGLDKDYAEQGQVDPQLESCDSKYFAEAINFGQFPSQWHWIVFGCDSNARSCCRRAHTSRRPPLHPRRQPLSIEAIKFVSKLYAQQLSAFGASARPGCPKCKGIMSVVCRGPSEYGELYERQVLECQSCEHETSRIVNRRGELVQ